MSINSKADFEGLRREANGNVAGAVVLRIYGEFAQTHFDETLERKDFNFPQGGEQEVYRTEFMVDTLVFTLLAKVHEQTAGQCCMHGSIHLHGPVGGGVGEDLDPSCQAIP